MEEINKRLKKNYSDDNLYLLLFYYHQMNTIEVMYFWTTIQEIIDENNVLIVLGFVLDLQDNSIIFPRYAQKALNFHIHQINKRIAKLLTRSFIFYTKSLKLFKFSRNLKFLETKETEFNKQTFLINYLYELFIKTPTVEFSNSIDNFCNLGEREVIIDFSKILLNQINKLDEVNKKKYIKYLSGILTSPESILDFCYFNNSNLDCEVLIEFLYLLNKPIYFEMLQIIYDNVKYYKLIYIKLLPEFDVFKFTFRDDNIEIIEFILKNKSKYLNDIVEVINNNLSRKTIIQLYIDNYSILKNFNFNFIFDEIIQISLKVPVILHNIYNFITNENQKAVLYSILKDLDEDFVVKFLKKNDDDDCVGFLLTNRPLKNSLKNYIIEKYKNNERFLYKLFIYLDKSEVLNYIERYLIDKKSLEYFLLILKPTDILINAHYLNDLTKGIRIIELCFNSSSFNENDFIYALNTIENSLPPLIIRTLILTFKKWSHLKNFTIGFLFKMINKKALNNDKLKIGVIKCLELIGISCVDVISSLSEENVRCILDKSRFLKNMCIEVAFKKENKYKKELEHLREIIRRRY